MSNNAGVVKDIPPEAEKSLEASLVSLVDGSQGPGGHPDQEARRCRLGCTNIYPVILIAFTASVAHADAIHTTGHHKSRRWISRLWPSVELVDKVRRSLGLLRS